MFVRHLELIYSFLLAANVFLSKRIYLGELGSMYFLLLDGLLAFAVLKENEPTNQKYTNNIYYKK